MLEAFGDYVDYFQLVKVFGDDARSANSASLGGKTPAMAAGIAQDVWTVEDIVKMLEAEERAFIGTEANKRGPYAKKPTA